MVRVWVLYASGEQRQEVTRLLSASSLRLVWKHQPHQPLGFQTLFEINGQAAELASDLARLGVVFEIEASNEIFLHHPGLGIKRLELDQAGEPVIRFGQLEKELVEAAGNHSEFQRRLRVLKGQPWFDLLEPYRLATLRADLMPRAV